MFVWTIGLPVPGNLIAPLNVEGAAMERVCLTMVSVEEVSPSNEELSACPFITRWPQAHQACSRSQGSGLLIQLNPSAALDRSTLLA